MSGWRLARRAGQALLGAIVLVMVAVAVLVTLALLTGYLVVP